MGSIEPHGGELVDLVADPARAAAIRALSRDWPSWHLTPRQICDLELLLNGAFSPLRGFLGRRDFARVCAEMRLDDGTLWPVPVTLDVTDEVVGRLSPGEPLALRCPEGTLLAALWVSETWELDRNAKATAVYGTLDRSHPGVEHLFSRTNGWAVAGRLEGVRSPVHYDFPEERRTPRELRADFARLGWSRVIAFQTRNPMHRAHHVLTLRAAQDLQAKLLIHPVVGVTKPGDVDHYTRVRCYQALLGHYPANTARLALLPLAMRMGGPREALWHAIIRKNFGCTHIIIGRDHAGPGRDAEGRPFYEPYAAQELFERHKRELQIEMVPLREMVFVEDSGQYVARDRVPAGARVLEISGTELRERLAAGREIPEWFTFPEVAEELRRSYPPRDRRGLTIFLTGLSGAGKSTLANVLLIKLLERGGRPVTLLDGDVVRRNLSSELGFSRADRDLNIRRIGFVAAEITKNGGIAICAPIAPYDALRREVRAMVAAGGGGFALVYVSTPLSVCEARDAKGHYAKAREGLIRQFTGISDPYEPPQDAEVVVDTSDLAPERAAEEVLAYLEREGYLATAASQEAPLRA